MMEEATAAESGGSLPSRSGGSLPRGSAFSSLLFGLGFLLLGIAATMWVANEIGLVKKESDISKWMAGYDDGLESGKKQRHGFTLMQLGDWRRDRFLLNQATGRLWQPICDTSGLSEQERDKSESGECAGFAYFAEIFVQGITPEDSYAAKRFLSYLENLSEP